MTDATVDRLNAALEGRYAIERELGEGGMATVYLADDLKHERKVALKVLKPELAAVMGAERFLAEIKTTANLQHPHILPLHNSTTVSAQVHTVSVSRRGQVRLEKVDIVFDAGFSLVNPLTVRKQIEGQMAWGYDDAMYQENIIRDGRAVDVNFDQYTVSRMNEQPREINIQFMESDHWLYGLGEEAIQQVAPAITSAVFQATGKRIRSLPLKNHDLSWG